jgi:hypothetical protein
VRLATVVPCTNSKSGPGPLHALGALDPPFLLEELAGRWIDYLLAARCKITARDLYQGPGWIASLRLVDALKGTGSELDWRIISAGYGLLLPTERVASYSATFLAGHKDSIPRAAKDADAAGVWWTLVNQFRNQPQPLVQFASKVDGLVVAASAPYVDAVSGELVEAAREVPTVVFCAGRPKVPAVAALVPRFDRRLREGDEPFVRGGDVGFNQRVATKVVQLLGPKVTDRDRVDEVLAAAMDREGPVRHE